MRHSPSCFFSNLLLERHTDTNDKRIVVTDKFFVTRIQRSNDRASMLMRIVLNSWFVDSLSLPRTFHRVFPRKPSGVGRARDQRVFYDPCKHRKTRGECFLLAWKRASIKFTRNHLPSSPLASALRRNRMGEVVDRFPYITRDDKGRGRTCRFLAAREIWTTVQKWASNNETIKFWNLRDAK